VLASLSSFFRQSDASFSSPAEERMAEKAGLVSVLFERVFLFKGTEKRHNGNFSITVV